MIKNKILLVNFSGQLPFLGLYTATKLKIYGHSPHINIVIENNTSRSISIELFKTTSNNGKKN
jgi:hypothetical protein